MKIISFHAMIKSNPGGIQMAEKDIKSDFRIVADYFVQIRKNKDYIPTDTQFTHVKEILQMILDRVEKKAS